MRDALHPPLSVIATWKPNYVDPETRGSGMIVMEAILLALDYIVVCLRLWTRLFLTRNFGLDDAWIIFNMLPITGTAICLWLGYLKYGLDRHAWDIPTPVAVESRKVVFALELFYTVSTTVTKISILLFYRRLTSGPLSRSFTYCIYAAIAFVALYLLGFVGTVFLGCRPFNAFWHQVDPHWHAAHKGQYRCFNEGAAIVAAALLSTLQDFIVITMPMIVFWKLQMPLRQKLALTLVFGIGFFLCVCSILRVIFTVRLFFNSYDLTWDAHPIWIVTAIEMHLAVVCASLPALNYFFRHASESSTYSASRLRSNRSLPQGPYIHDRTSGISPMDDIRVNDTDALKLKDFSNVGVCEKPGLSFHTKNGERKGLPALPSAGKTWLRDDSSSSSEREVRRFT